jgi:pantoate--beta-alanine ligase
MRLIHRIAEVRQLLQTFQRPVLVPTMGNLHDGHLALVKQAQQLGDATVVSIFVNRLQFGPDEDFDRYPRTLQADCAKLEAAGCDLVFAPTETEFYPETQQFTVVPPSTFADILEGHFRPGFFTGVCTVVHKMFNIVQPTAAVFGKKDYQQLLVIRHMVRQLALPIAVHGLATTRAQDGLALSSRNSYLTADERAKAVQLHQALQGMVEQLQAGHALAAIESRALNTLSSLGWQVDYLTLRRQQDLATPDPSEPAQPLVALGAARLGQTRLIDNLDFVPAV